MAIPSIETAFTLCLLFSQRIQIGAYQAIYIEQSGCLFYKMVNKY